MRRCASPIGVYPARAHDRRGPSLTHNTARATRNAHRRTRPIPDSTLKKTGMALGQFARLRWLWHLLWLALAPLSALQSQIDPSHHWLTISTQHFYVHFTTPIEPLARRIAADAERAYEQLSHQ